MSATENVLKLRQNLRQSNAAVARLRQAAFDLRLQRFEKAAGPTLPISLDEIRRRSLQTF